MAWLTARRAFAARLAQQVDEDGGGGGWVNTDEMARLSRTKTWREEAQRMGVQMLYVEWPASVMGEFMRAGYVRRKKRGLYQKTELWPKVWKMAEEYEPRLPTRASPPETSQWGELRWVTADILDRWPAGEKITAKKVTSKVHELGMDGLAAGRALADFASRNQVLRRVQDGVYEKTEGWGEVAEALEGYRKRGIEEELGKGTITLHKGPLPPIEDAPTPPSNEKRYTFEDVLREVVEDTTPPPPDPNDQHPTPPATIGARPPAIITIDDLITHAEGLARQVVEWHGKYQQAVVLLRNKEADVEAAMRMLSEMEEQVMKKNVELEEAKGELITLQKQYEVAMDRARRAPIIPMINSKVTEDKGLTDEDKTPPTNGGGAAA